METAIIVVCVVIAREASDAEDGNVRCLEIVQNGKVIRIEGEDVVPARAAKKE